MNNRKWVFVKIFAVIAVLSFYRGNAQTENDGIMMKKNQWCNGATYMYSSWDEYWEGTYKRNNQNIGTVTTQSVMFMSNYGISDKLNVLASLPYVWTHASAGTLHGMNGLQDVMVSLKWKAVIFDVAKGKLSLFGVGSFSTPASDYTIDFLPMSIGLGSTDLTGRITADYQKGIFYTTLSGAYVWRSNVKIDRNAYYTTEQHNTNEVEMPDQLNFNLNVGIRKKYLVAEVNVENVTTLGGFDIRKNDMPFVSNRMNATSLGVHAKYTLPFFTHIEVLGGGGYVIAGRNVGQAVMFHAGAYYIFKL
ncbi:MAG TPA: hypothetical protein VMH01_04255 [Puia sp.]|nr:hypothetical protein [Puia sp.]